ncbi:hypothetical protein LJC20_00520 [Eubacteriales bacterium OttesenSCG-928-M02]|nr:hypothetical protein [Eubacteriales bacterium OttesenSCG-928-M02]
MNQITFGEKQSYNDWGVILSSWSLTGAAAKTEYIDVPAADGTLDLTEVLAGEPRYNDRTLTCKFTFPPPRTEWERIRQAIANYCNGQRMKIWVPDCPDYYLVGRVSVDTLTRNRGYALLNVTAACEPWLYKNDPTEVILDVAESYSGVLVNDRRRVIPEITTDAAISVRMNDLTKELSAGTFVFADFALKEGENPIEITGSANVVITYQEGVL